MGFHVAGVLGALSATIGAFIAPWALATLAAQQVKRFAENRKLRAFGSGAAPAVVGVLGVTILNLGREAFPSWSYVLIAAIAFGLARWTRTHPAVLLVFGGLCGYLLGL